MFVSKCMLVTFTLLCISYVLGGSDPLFLTPFITSGNLTEARHLSLVLTLPDASPDLPNRPSYSGLITVNKTSNSNLFFWFFPASTELVDTPVVLWLDGGPGISSFLSIFTQNGPFYVKSSSSGSFSLEPRLEDWTVNRSIIYLESPVDVGFSFTSDPAGLPKTSEEVAENSVEFLRQFFLLFPEYVSNPFHIVGQSYGGHFAPAVGTALHKRNENRQEPRINFQEMLLIAPWVNPLLQVDSYAEFMFQTALIDETVKEEIVKKQELMKSLVVEEKYVEAKDVWTEMLFNPHSAFNVASGFTTVSNLLQDQLDPNYYLFGIYVESPEFRQAVHVGNLTYTLVSVDIQNSLAEEFMASKSEHIEELLRARIYKVIVAIGQMDLTVIHSGAEKMLDNIVWSWQNEWKMSNRTIWRSANGHVAGYKKEVSNLALYLIRNAGHMLVGDQPAVILELVNKVWT